MSTNLQAVCMTLNPYTQTAVWKRLADAGANVTDVGSTISARDVGAEFPGVSEEVAALAKAEAEFESAFEAMGAQEGEKFVPIAEKDKATGRGFAAFQARREASNKLADAVEDAREAAVEQADTVEAESVAGALELLDLLEDKLDTAGRASYIRSAARDTNPSRRQSPMPTAFRRPGGELAAQLRDALQRVGQAEYYVLPGDQFEKYLRGDPALDVYGSEVPPGLPSNRVRRSYNPTTFRDVAVRDLRGGVG